LKGINLNIIHHISFRRDSLAHNYFHKARIKLKGGIIMSFDIGENDKNWKIVRDIISDIQGDVLDFQLRTEFTRDEILQADYFALEPNWHFGYPQPEDNFGYLKKT
jgi:hypothetical protein